MNKSQVLHQNKLFKKNDRRGIFLVEDTCTWKEKFIDKRQIWLYKINSYNNSAGYL